MTGGDENRQCHLFKPVPDAGSLGAERPGACGPAAARRPGLPDRLLTEEDVAMSGEPAAAAEAPGTGSKPELRASHEDRDQVVEILRVAAGDGRLTAAELDERLEAALTARTHSDLAKLTADLPAAGLQGGIPQRARELVRIDHMGGNVKRVGRWVVPQRMEIHSVGGNVKLDFTDAVITQPRCGSRRRVPAGSPCRDRRRLDAAFALCHAFDAPIAACTRRSGRDGVAGGGRGFG